ncbi:MerR, DNA binding [Rhizobiales bacterium GAS113]|nr:MerR, DNA binding [Rhizobiales bacterium GAS113]
MNDVKRQDHWQKVDTTKGESGEVPPDNPASMEHRDMPIEPVAIAAAVQHSWAAQLVSVPPLRSEEAPRQDWLARDLERIGLMSEPAPTASDYRMHGAENVQRLSFIRRAREVELNIDEIQRLLTIAEQSLVA